MDSKSIEDEVIQIQSRSVPDPPLSDIDFKNKMAGLPLKRATFESVTIKETLSYITVKSTLVT